MRRYAKRAMLGAVFALSGCTAGVVGSPDGDSEVRLLTDTVARARCVVPAEGDVLEQLPVEQAQDVTLAQASMPVEDASGGDADPAPVDASVNGDDSPFNDDPQADNPSSLEDRAAGDEPAIGPAVASDQAAGNELEFPSTPTPEQDAEPIVTPGPLPGASVKPGSDAKETKRIDREITEVELDIRPTGDNFPEDLASKRFAGEPTFDETWPSDEPADVFCSYTPWTICYRPLYFEDIKLERYGSNVGYLQTGLSGLRFFSSIAALPYKMTVRPPRSCQCSNGFSRCGDCPLPGYGRRKFQWSAAMIEAAAVAGVVYILP